MPDNGVLTNAGLRPPSMSVETGRAISRALTILPESVVRVRLLADLKMRATAFAGDRCSVQLHKNRGRRIRAIAKMSIGARHNRPWIMSPQPITAASRELLGKLRSLLLEQHKLLLDRERAAYEKANGPIAGPGPFLTLVLGDPHFAWLKQISTLIVEIDEALSRRSSAGQAAAQALTEQARVIMRPREQGTDFQVRYFQAIQQSPDIVIVQCRIEQLLD